MRFFALLACLCTALLLLPATASATDVVQSWSQTFQSTGGDSPFLFTTDSKGGVYTVSYVPFANAGDFWIIRKMNSLGQFQWSQSFFAANLPAAIAVDLNGNLYITSSSGIGAASSILTVKILSNGDIGWVNEFASGVGYAINTDSAGNVYVAGASTASVGALLIKYSSLGAMLNSSQRTDIDTDSMFFMPNGFLVVNGRTPGTYNPYMEVLSSAGVYLYSSVTDDSSPDFYEYVITCDSASNLYLVVNHGNSNTNAYTFTIDCYGSNGAFNWQTDVTDGQVQEASASDPNHAYVQVSNGTSYTDFGFGANGVRFFVVSAQPGLIAADGTKGLVTETSNSTAFTYSEVNADLQTLWSQTYSAVQPKGPLALRVINSTIYSLNVAMVNNEYATNFVKYVQGTGISGLTPTSTSTQGGKSVTLTVLLNDVAPAGGLTAYFVSSSSALGLPASTPIGAGVSSLTITALTTPVDVTTTISVAAEVNGGIRNATVILTPSALSAVTFPAGTNASVVGGKTITGTITLSGPTALLARSITLSSNSAKATVAATANILPGASSATFVVSASAVTASTPVVITAKSAGVTVTAKLTITP